MQGGKLEFWREKVRCIFPRFCKNLKVCYLPDFGGIGKLIRWRDGIIRRTYNLCLSCLLEDVRERKKNITTDAAIRALIQPHWPNEQDMRDSE